MVFVTKQPVHECEHHHHDECICHGSNDRSARNLRSELLHHRSIEDGTQGGKKSCSRHHILIRNILSLLPPGSKMLIYTHIDRSRLKTMTHCSDCNKMSSFVADCVSFANGTTEALPGSPAHFVRNVLFALPLSSSNRAVKERSMAVLAKLAEERSEEVSHYLPEIVPILADCMVDIRKAVKDAAKDTLVKCCKSIGNKDIDPFVPHLIESISDTSQVPECVHKLSATTFVQTVDARTLAVLVPLICRGLAERTTVVKRKTCVIINNMSRLVEDPADAYDFSSKLINGVKNVLDGMSNPEARAVASTCYDYLLKLNGTVAQHITYDKIFEIISSRTKDAETVAGIVDSLVRAKPDFPVWKSALEAFADEDLIVAVFEALGASTKEDKAKETEEGEDLCDCEFSLAYGGKILLNSTRLNIKRGNHYGLIGPNGAGKSTLLRAIANGQLEGFPDASQLRTVYVDHDIDASVSDMTVYDYLSSDPDVANRSSPERIVQTLLEYGFDESKHSDPIGSLSGGWKMKLSLTRAILIDADILLLDEPTNHMDVGNVAWLAAHLKSLKNVSSIIVSHDSGFLDAVCSAIVHYEKNLKLTKHLGNLSAFVEKRPEAASYYDLKDSMTKWEFPEPGFLEGITSKDRAIMKLRGVAFAYQTGPEIFSDVNSQVSMNSRIGVIGPNGAGKTTLIKVLTGETQPTQGSVWKHPNMRMAYVHQHAFHHIENHLDITPNQYIQYRYASGQDLESVDRAERNSVDDRKIYEIKVVDGVKKRLERLGFRRKFKRTYQYEVYWKNEESPSWIVREKLEEFGFQKLLAEVDAKDAAANGLLGKPLTAKNIEDHMAKIGLDPEFTSHSRIRGLSGGQKVKLVVGAALWQCPHVIVLDEPTNYLDRESLGALSSALESFGGGVVVISHSTEFIKKTCSEMWTVGGGKVDISGQTAPLEISKYEVKQAEEYVDALGNTVKVKEAPRELSRQEKKKRAKERKARLARGEEVSDDEDDL
ncbi:elongation factor 3 [Acanthocystis turfacea Chlorella virus NE-JV-2]|nr:elongation factor 3 [Acanthocystis turfacea Chlorella virus NE-JV-2]